MNRSLSLSAVLATATLCSAAFAADLPSRKEPPLPLPPLFSWTGIYAGANIGGSFGFGRSGGSGVTGGGEIGYNYQLTPLLVAGVEADIEGTSVRAGRRSIDYFGTVRGLVGLSPFDPHILVYGAGGFAYAQVRYGVNDLNDNRTGWTAGGGLEWAFHPNWSAKVEYLYTEISTSDLVANPITGRHLSDTHFHTVRAGVNYHFTVFPPAPILAAK